MTLDKIAQGSAPPVAFATLGGDTALATEVQQRLTEAGLLEPRAGLAMYRTDADMLVAMQQLPAPVARA